MANRYPLISNVQRRRIEELAFGDNLNLTGSGIVGATSVTSQVFYGNLVGIASTALTLTSAANILSGTISSQRLSGYYPIEVNFSRTAEASGLFGGLVPRNVLGGSYDINITGIAQTANFLQNAANINSGIIEFNRLSGTYNIDITGTANTAFSLPPGTYEIDIDGSSVYSSTSGFSTFSGTADYALISGISTEAENLIVSYSDVGYPVYPTFVSGIGATPVSISTSLSYIPEFGKFGINTSIPNYTLDVDGDIAFTGLLYVNSPPTEIKKDSGTLYSSTIIGVDTSGLSIGDIVVDDPKTYIISPNTKIQNIGIGSVTIFPQHIVSVGNVPVNLIFYRDNPVSSGSTNFILISNGDVTPPEWIDPLKVYVGIALTSIDVIGGVGQLQELDVSGVTTTTNLDVTGVSTTKSLNVLGITTTTDLEVIGVSTIKSLDVLEITTTKDLNVTGVSTTKSLNVLGLTTTTDLEVIGVSTFADVNANNITVLNDVIASSFQGNGSTLTGIVTQITAGIGVKITSTETPGKGKVNIDAYQPTGKTIFVTQNGNDNNTGLSENHAKRTIKAASTIAVFGDTIKVYPGVYVEENPIYLKKTVSVEGTELRNCVVTPKYPYLDLFYVNNGCHITDMSFIGPDMTDGASIVALQPLEGVAVDRYFDAARMIRLNLDYIAAETVGFLTSGFSGFAGNHREQDAARLIDLNLNYIAAETVGFLTTSPPNGYGFTLSGEDYTNCREDIVSVFSAISHDLKENSNRKSVGAALSYFNNSGSLIHITGISTQQATIAAFNYAVGIAKSVINNLRPSVSYQTGISSVSQVIDLSVIQTPGGCVSVANTISELVGIITSSIGAGNTSGLPDIRYGVTLESKDCSDDIKDIWKCIIHDITRGGNSRCVDAGEAYYDENWNLIPQILKNPGEISQTVAALDYSFNVARAVVNNCTWGGYPVGLGTTVINSSYDYNTGITTITAINHGLNVNDAVKIQNLMYECNSGSPGEPIGILTASYNFTTGITTITTKTSHQLSSGMVVKLDGLVFQCNSGGGISTAIYPSGNYGYNFTVQDVLSPFQYVVNVGISTLNHTYVNGGTSTRLYTPTFGVSTAVYNNITGISTITTVGFGTTSNVGMYIEPGKKVKLKDLVFQCNSGGGPSTAIYPSGNLGYSFEVISTNDDRYIDASNLIESNRTEIIDKSLASIAISHPDFYFPVGVQTTKYSRFKDSYRLIQQNKQLIIDSAWNIAVGSFPSISSTQTKCKRDIGYFVDAVSTDIFTGGNVYSIDFVKQYFDANENPISNGLVGEEAPSIFAFNAARDYMKLAITNQLTIKDLTLTPDPVTGSNTSVNSCSNVKSTIDTLTEIITSVIDEGNLDYLNSISRNNGIFVLGENKCRRDIGFIVDALIKDVRYGTNKHIRESVRAYFNANGTPISNGLVGEEAPSITAFNSIRDYAKSAMRNQLNVKDLTITVDPLTGNNQSNNSCSNVATNIDNLISILTTSILNGNLNSFPNLYVSNKIKVNVGVSTLAHNYVSGGTVTSNYTTNIFPDGTYNYIFPVNNVIDSDTFEFVGGKTNLPHTYVSGGTIQKYTNFQREFTQVKDLAIQVDPETGFNNSINSCSNVISAIHSCVGIVTTIVGLGSESNIKKSYPGNSGNGIKNYYNVFDATYDNTDGKTVINAPGISVEVGDLVEIRDLVFECTSGGSPSTQKFPSGIFGYEFFVEKVNTDGTFEVRVGISSLEHTYISGGIVINRTFDVSEAYYNNLTGITTITVPGLSIETGDLVKIKDLEFSCASGSGTTTIYPTGNKGFVFRVLDIVSDKPYGITSAIYNNISGIVTLTAPGANIKKEDVVEIRDLEFSCPDSPPNLSYPSGKNGYKFPVKYVNSDNSFVLDVGVSTLPHTYVSGGTVINRTKTSNDTFTINVGVSTIPHTYVSGGTVLPPFSRGVGPITQGPYVRNCTNFIPKSIGMKVDGFAAEPGDKDDIGITGTMSVDSYTQYNQGGIGVSITNGAYAQLVSIFTICDDIAIFTGSGGQCDITNSNSSFGRFGLVSDGLGDQTTKSIYRYTGNIASTANAEQSIITVSGIGNYRPYDGQALYFGELFYTVQRVEIINGGSNYTSSPTILFDSPPEGVNGIRAEAIANVQNGSVVSIDLISTGTQYRVPPNITFVGGGGSGATAKSIMAPIYYTIESATLPSSGISTITLNTNLNSTVSTGTTVYFSRLSLQIVSSHSFEWVGSGNDINKAKPSLGGVVVQENEVVKINGGECVYTSTDQAGNFRIGDGLVVNQLTGTVSGRAFNQSLINTVTPLIIALG